MNLYRDDPTFCCQAVVEYLGERPWLASLAKANEHFSAFVEVGNMLRNVERYVGKRVLRNPTNRGVKVGDIVRVTAFPLCVLVGFEHTEQGPVMEMRSLLEDDIGVYRAPLGATLGEKPDDTPQSIWKVHADFAHENIRRLAAANPRSCFKKVLDRYRWLASAAMLDE